MSTHQTIRRVFSLALLLAPSLAWAGEATDFERTPDVVYGRKYGTALTLDVFAPKGEPNGAAVVFVVSGGWFSAYEMINPQLLSPFLKRGYMVFAVVHGSQPKFTIPEIIEDLHRAMRFIRHNAARFRIDPDRIGITGGSAGGHLSLMMGLGGGPGAANAKDPIDRVSSKPQAVACFFPPTDFLNYGEPGRDVFKALQGELSKFRAPFDFRELDKNSGRLVFISARDRRKQIAKEISPITHVTPDDPPTLIIHGDADKLVPIQQAEVLGEKLRDAGVPFKLVVREGQGHGWAKWEADLEIMADWFDAHFVSRSSQPADR